MLKVNEGEDFVPILTLKTPGTQPLQSLSFNLIVEPFVVRGREGVIFILVISFCQD